MQVVDALRSVNLPRSQTMQLEVPGMSLYLPGTHEKHLSPFAPVYPTLQRHAVMLMLPSADDMLGGHDRQCDTLSFPL